jgi:hypothetical protein
MEVFWLLWNNIYEYVFIITVAIVMLLKDFGLYGIIFMNIFVSIIVAIVMLLKDVGPYWITF